MKRVVKVVFLVLMISVSAAMFLACESQSKSKERIEAAFAKMDEAYALDISMEMKMKVLGEEETTSMHMKVSETEDRTAASMEVGTSDGEMTAYFLDGCMYSADGSDYNIVEADLDEFMDDYSVADVPTDMPDFFGDSKIKKKSESGLTKYTITLDESALGAIMGEIPGGDGIETEIVLRVWLDKKDNLKKLEYDAEATYLGIIVSMTMTMKIEAIDDDVEIDFPEQVLERIDIFNRTHTLTLTPDYAKGSVEGAGEYLEGSSVVVKATAYDYYKFVGWFDNNVLVSSDAEYTFTMPTKDLTLTAKFELEV